MPKFVERTELDKWIDYCDHNDLEEVAKLLMELKTIRTTEQEKYIYYLKDQNGEWQRTPPYPRETTSESFEFQC